MISTIIGIVFIYLIYYLWISFNYDKKGNVKNRGKKKKDNKSIPAEFQLFVYKYNIDMKKVNTRYFLQFLALIIAFDLSITVTIMSFINILWLKLLLGFILMIIIVFISFEIAGSYFKKKGLVLNDKTNNKSKTKRK